MNEFKDRLLRVEAAQDGSPRDIRTQFFIVAEVVYTALQAALGNPQHYRILNMPQDSVSELITMNDHKRTVVEMGNFLR